MCYFKEMAILDANGIAPAMAMQVYILVCSSHINIYGRK